jgi:hypothetical protein
MLRYNHRLLLLAAISLAALLGCSQTKRMPIEGTVSLDGQPLEKGSIAFRPLPGTTGPTAGATIANGKFAIVPSGGPFAGNFVVEVSNVRPTGQKVHSPRTGGLVDERSESLPARYNSRSELRAEVTANGPNQFEFALKSQ